MFSFFDGATLCTVNIFCSLRSCIQTMYGAMASSKNVSSRSHRGSMLEPDTEEPPHGARHAWSGYLFQTLERVGDTIWGVELTDKWRLHIVYGKSNGKELIALFTQRFASLSTMTTLLLGSQLSVLFSPSRPTEKARTALETRDIDTVAFWAGLFLCLGTVISVLTLLAILTAWSLMIVISEKNSHLLLRSSIFIYAAALPVRLAILSVYLYYIWINLFFYVLAAWQVALPITVIFTIFFFHISTTYSAVGRIIMHSGAMGDERIEERTVEYELSPDQLSEILVEKTMLAKAADIPIHEQYRIKYQEQLDIIDEGGSLRLEELRLPEEEYLGSDYGEDEEVGDKKSD